MKKRNVLCWILVLACLASLLSGCAGARTSETDEALPEEGAHEAVTMQSPFRNVTPFVDLVKQKYPEINLQVIPYSGANTTAYVTNQLIAGDMPDIYMTTIYAPGQRDLSERLLDLSGYAFTNNYSEARLRDVSENGAIYLLPTHFTCLGITYNKTLLEENGWALPTTFAELEALAPKVREAGYNLAVDQIALPGYGFQYLCNILDTDFLNTLDGRGWQNDFLRGSTTVKDAPQMLQAMQTLEKWRQLGMLNGSGSWESDEETKQIMAEGKTLFMLGSLVSFKEGESRCEFGIMPYLSDDGTQNALILNVNRYIGLNKHLADPGNEQKLADAIRVMEVMSTVEGLSALNTGFEDNTLLPLRDYVVPESNVFKQVESELNRGLTAPFIYAGWDNLIVPIGNVMLDYIKGRVELSDVIAALDDNQRLLTDNSEAAYTTVTEKLDTDDCAKLVGICFAQASGADLAMVSKNKWYRIETYNTDLNTNGVSGSLFALPVTDQEITSILPTGWRGNIETVTLTGQQVKELMKTGYVYKDMAFPYELVTPEGMTIDDGTTYTVAICGISDEIAEAGNLTDTGILGLDAARAYFSRFETLSPKDIRWE